MAAHKRTFLEKLAYIFAPADSKGLGFWDRWTMASSEADAWVARPDNPKEKQLIDMLAILSASFGITPPKLIIYESGIPNASSNSLSGSIAVSTRTMEIMPPEQMMAILAHEMCHHAHIARDAPVVIGLPIAYGAARATLGLHPWQYATSRKSKLAFAAAEVAGFGATIVIPRAWMRQAEFEADATAAKLTNPKQMIAALDTLQNDVDRIIRKHDEAIIEAGGTPPDRQQHTWRGALESTHPTIEMRKERLRNIPATEELRKNVSQKMRMAEERGHEVFSSR